MMKEEVRESLASGYAAGSLDPGLRLLVDAQSAVAPPGRQIIAHERPIIGPHALQPPTAPQSLTEELSLLPAVLQDAAIRAQAQGKWKAPIPGLKILPLDVKSSAEANLLRVTPKAAIPRHTHEGVEYALVLAGVLDDGVGRYLTGEISVADATVTHSPRAADEEVCWLLIVRFGRIRLTGLPGILQRLLGR